MHTPALALLRSQLLDKGQHLVLLGFMGSGKSRQGYIIAQRLELPFLDLDERIEAQQGRSIERIFSENGPNAFRQLEREALQEALQGPPSVLSLGGGTPCYFDNMALIRRSGLSLYLRLSAEHLAQRLGKARKNRPLLQGLHGLALLDYIRQMLAQREPFYAQADIVVDIRHDAHNTEYVLAQVLAALGH